MTCSFDGQVAIVTGAGGPNASVEDIGENFGKITDLTGAKPRGMLQLGEM